MGVDFKIDILLLFLCEFSIIQSVTVPLTCWNTKSSYPESELVSSLLKNENPDLFSLIKTKKDTNKFEIDNIRKRLQGNGNSQKPQKMKTPDPSSWTRRNLDVDTTKPPDPIRSSTQENNFNLDLLKYEHFDPTARSKDMRLIEIDNTPKTFTEGSHLKNELLRYGKCKLISSKTESDIKPFEVDFRNFNQGNNERLSTIIKAEEDLKQSNGIKTVLQNPLQEVSNRVQNSGIRFPSNVVQTSPAFFTCTQPNLQAAQSCLVQNPKLNDKLYLQESSLQMMKEFDNFASNNFPPLPMDYKVVNRFETPGLQSVHLLFP
ncbi:uncharacterized protein LOC123879106 [Maniola jurtina]|uniref:uncharacterized protein LOC123879106 n=1 Tax=Maniola jurtina TaxID=191418 RepID=UPI001E68B282|nr:uncharacterized protein LOC123879106 [Maniola jurtina]